MNYEDGQIVYRKRIKNCKVIISQEIVRKQEKDKVFVYGEKKPLKYKKVSSEPDYLLKKNNKQKKYIYLVIGLILFSIAAPYLFTHFSFINLAEDEYATIADTIYGLTGPFIAVAAAILTFIAFLIQKQANDIQIESTNIQIKRNQIESFENRLFKLIDAHRQNVDDLYFESVTFSGNEIIFKGQEAISALTFTLSVVAMLVKKMPKIDVSFNKMEQQVFSYLVFVHGNSLADNIWFNNREDYKKYSNKENTINELVDAIDKMLYGNLTTADGNIYYIKQAIIKRKSNLLISIRRNLMNTLSRYFRQIYQIFVYIDSQTFLTKEQKYQYAKLFRTNLTNAEQELMYNNILSPYGNEWRNKQLILKYKPFKNIASFGKYCYSPYDYLRDFYKLSQEELKDNLDVLTFDDKI